MNTSLRCRCGKPFGDITAGACPRLWAPLLQPSLAMPVVCRGRARGREAGTPSSGGRVSLPAIVRALAARLNRNDPAQLAAWRQLVEAANLITSALATLAGRTLP